MNSFLKTSFRKNAIFIIAAIGVIAAGTTFRLYPKIYYPSLVAKNTARLMVYTKIRKNLQQSIRERHSELTPERREEIHTSLFKTTLQNKRQEIENSITHVADGLLVEEKLKNSPLYLLAADPYYYFNLTRKLIRTGRIADEFRNFEYFNDQMLAPLGHWYPFDLHPYVGAGFYYVFRLFYPGISLEWAVALVPVFLAALIVLFFMFVLRKNLALGPAAAALGALYLALCPIFLKRNLLGFYDTDAYNVFFPMVILSCILTAFSRDLSLKTRYSTVIGATLIMQCYALFWRGWALVHAMLVVSVLLFVLLRILFKAGRLPVKMLVSLSLLYSCLPLVWIYWFWGSESLEGIVAKSAELARNFSTPSFKLWPDVFMIVGELNNLELVEMIRFLGGGFFFLMAIAGFLWRLKTANAFDEKDSRPAAWIASTLFVLSVFIGLKAERLALFVALPTAVGVAFFVDHLFRTILARLGKPLRHAPSSKVTPGHLVVLLVGLLFVGLLFHEAHKITYYQHSIYNAAWDRAMKSLRDQSPVNSIVTSWWSPGHFISSMAERRVTFDGATQNTPQAYWVANLYLESDELKALGILRMLDTAGNQAVEYLIQSGKKLSDSVRLTREIVPQSRPDAEEWIREHDPDMDAQKLLSYTHGRDLPPAYLFIYNDMVDKAMGLEFIGRWSFEKAEKFKDYAAKYPHKLKKDILKRASVSNVKLMWSLSEGPWMQDGKAFETGRNQDVISFSNGLKLNPKDMTAELKSGEFGSGIPKSIFFIKDGALVEKKLLNANLIFSVLLIEDPNPGRPDTPVTYQTVLSDERLIRSLLYRLYYLDGEGLRHIKPFFKEIDFKNRTQIYIYEVDWNSFSGLD